jgi:hypothetical protein
MTAGRRWQPNGCAVKPNPVQVGAVATRNTWAMNDEKVPKIVKVDVGAKRDSDKRNSHALQKLFLVASVSGSRLYLACMLDLHSPRRRRMVTILNSQIPVQCTCRLKLISTSLKLRAWRLVFRATPPAGGPVRP